jgi:uroporphyrinogen-III decarboxylase
MLRDEALCLAMYDDPGFVADIIQTYIDMCISIWKKMVQDIRFDIIECWEDMAYKNGSIISKKHFMEFLAPQYNRIRDFAGESGIPLVMVDSDGNIMDLSEWMNESGINCMYPFEAQSGNDIAHIRKFLPGMGCIGGLDKECMAKDKNAMDEELEKARRLIPLGKFIPGPDHFVLENVPFENYSYFMRGLKQAIIETKF